MSYQIKVKYQTGDSFGSQDTEDIIELDWNNLDVAKQNLQRIKEHYEQYRQLNGWRNEYGHKDRDSIIEKNKTKDWFVGEDNTTWSTPEYCIKLYTDDGKPFQISCFWCGYFEYLHGAEIITSGDSDISFSF